MGIDEIRALPVAELAEKDCALFLWVTIRTTLQLVYLNLSRT